MGKLFEKFAGLKFHNEAEVTHNFLVPLLTEWLGYRQHEIYPEHHFPINIPLNRTTRLESVLVARRVRPDFVISLDERNSIAFVCDSKGPNESLDEHIEQVIAYSIALGNLILLTNGRELRLYDAHQEIFRASTIEELDLNFDQLEHLVGRRQVLELSLLERLNTLDLSKSLVKAVAGLQAEQQRQIALALSDFSIYLDTIVKLETVRHLPLPVQDAFNSDLRRFPADKLYTFEMRGHRYPFSHTPTIDYFSLLGVNVNSSEIPLLIVGESGIGKTTLLEQVLLDQANLCIELKTQVIPVLIKLSFYSSTQSLVGMIEEKLVSSGAKIEPNYVHELLREGRLLLLFDAFDEVFESDLPTVQRQLQLIIQDYPNSGIIITTRHFRIPQLQPLRQYEISTLSVDIIGKFAALYLEGATNEFIMQLRQQRLLRIASNSLLLTLLVMLFRQSGVLPASRGRILKAIVERVRDVEHEKQERFGIPLSWEIRTQLLSRLASSLLTRGMSYSLDKSAVNDLLVEQLDSLSRLRQIPISLTIPQVINFLATTGFVVPTNGGVLFWHRAFVEYFAAQDVSVILPERVELIDELISKPEWENVLPLAIAMTASPDSLIVRAMSLNVFTAATALFESTNCSPHTYIALAQSLAKKCSSTIIPIRQLAIGYLCRFPTEYVRDLLLELLDSPYVDVKKTVLVEITQRQLPDARSIVFRHLDWNIDAPTWAEGHSLVAVIESLALFDEHEAHLYIIRFWQEQPDIFTSFACREAFLEIIGRGAFTELTAQALLDFLLYGFNEEESHHKIWDISEVFVAAKYEKIVPKLLNLSRSFKSDSMVRESLQTILASFESSETIQYLITCFNKADSQDTQEFIAKVLVETQGAVPMALFEALANDDNYLIRSYGIKGLGKFPFEQIRHIILDAVHQRRTSSSPQEQQYVYVQVAAFEILASHNEIKLLLDEQHFPDLVYYRALDVVLRAIADGNLRDMRPLLNGLVERIEDISAKIKLASTYAAIGESEHAIQLFQAILQSETLDKSVIRNILKEVHLLPPKIAIEIVEQIIANNDVIALHLAYSCIEALEAIGSLDAVSHIVSLVELGTASNTLIWERGIRAIEHLAPKDKEEWLIQIINKNPNMGYSGLRRGLETLGVIGTSKCIPLLQKNLLESSVGDIQVTCFWAIHEIYTREGILWYFDEEKISLE